MGLFLCVEPRTVRPELVEGLAFFNPFSLKVLGIDDRYRHPISFALSLSKGSTSSYDVPMAFWAYMLHCSDRSFYVGHTDNLEARIAAHTYGQADSYTSTRLPIVLVWSQAFPTRLEALEAERRLKGWSRAKKLALIREDWPLISHLARNRQQRTGLSNRSG